MPISVDAGQRAESDFGQIEVDFPEGRRTISVLMITWAYSGAVFAIALPSEKTEAIHQDCILVGSSGTGKTHLAISLCLSACRAGKRVRFFTAANLVQKLEQAQQEYTLERFQKQLDKTELLICDELGYLSFSRSGAELLFQIFADRYERSSTLITTNLPFSEWQQIFQGERMTAALLDRLTHHCEIFEMTGESYRFRESMKKKQASP